MTGPIVARRLALLLAFAPLAASSGCVLETEGSCDPGACSSGCLADGFGGGRCEDGSCRCLPAGPTCDGGVCNADCVAWGNASGHCEGASCVCVPAGPTCDAAACNASCVSAGNASGRCEGASCVCVPPAGPECTDHSHCDRQSLCLSEHCVLAYGRDYRIGIESASGIPEVSFDGSSWDVPGGLPDPFVVFVVVGVGSWRTSTRENTLAPVWGERVEPVRVNESTRVRVELWDEDLSSHDPILGTWDDASAFPVEVAWIKDGGFAMQGEGVRVDFSITPL